ncbi:MAG: NIPSNAP family protein [Acidimicrobiales bacterium]
MLFELRQYKSKPGLRDQLVEVMETKVLPYQMSMGIAVVASFVAEDDPDGYVWIRRFESAEERDRLTTAVYGSEEWTEVIRPLLEPVFDREAMVVTTLLPTQVSPLH